MVGCTNDINDGNDENTSIVRINHQINGKEE
jgi:hypothetical protein